MHLASWPACLDLRIRFVLLGEVCLQPSCAKFALPCFFLYYAYHTCISVCTFFSCIFRVLRWALGAFLGSFSVFYCLVNYCELFIFLSILSNFCLQCCDALKLRLVSIENGRLQFCLK